jgi:hypothetical protein
MAGTAFHLSLRTLQYTGHPHPVLVLVNLGPPALITAGSLLIKLEARPHLALLRVQFSNVHGINYTSDEVTLIKMTKAWSASDFLYAIERLQVDQPKERRDSLFNLYRNLRKDREEEEGRLAVEQLSAKRYADIVGRLDEIKRPHWTITPNFWMTVVILIISVIGVFVAVWAAGRH